MKPETEMIVVAVGAAAILFVMMACSGCSMVACNRTFPKPEWYWSADAVDCRADHRVQP